MKKNNARLEGVILRCDRDEIHPGNEICFNYNREQLQSKDFTGFMATGDLFDTTSEES